MRAAARPSSLILSIGTATSALVAASGGASAGGFALHAESTQFLGSALAGDAAGGALSSMFWIQPRSASSMAFVRIGIYRCSAAR